VKKTSPLLSVQNISKSYTVSSGFLKKETIYALQQVSFDLQSNQTLGVVGESGCGKSTLAKVLLGIESPDTGAIYTQKGNNLLELSQKERAKTIQMVFQDPYSSLNPRKTIFESVATPLSFNKSLSKKEIKDQVLGLLDRVGISPDNAKAYPHQFSGGQRQRIGLARGLITNPEILICDEAVSALDVSIQADILNLLVDLQEERKLAYLFISHDLSVVHYLSHTILVMYLGKIVEMGNQETILRGAKHPYTQSLLKSCYPEKFSNFSDLKSDLPSPFECYTGCEFASRCPYVADQCREKEIPFHYFSDGHSVSCLLRH